MLRACPGTRATKPRRSSVSTIECTLGGVIWKYRCTSASAGTQPFYRAVTMDVGEELSLTFGGSLVHADQSEIERVAS